MVMLATGLQVLPLAIQVIVIKMKTKTSWWSLTIQDYPNFKPNEADLEHIAKCIKEGYDQGQLVQEEEEDV